MEIRPPDITQSPDAAYSACRYRDACKRHLIADPTRFIQIEQLPCPCSHSWIKEIMAITRAEEEAAQIGYSSVCDYRFRRLLESEHHKKVKDAPKRERVLAVTQSRLAIS